MHKEQRTPRQIEESVFLNQVKMDDNQENGGLDPVAGGCMPQLMMRGGINGQRANNWNYDNLYVEICAEIKQDHVTG